MERSRKRDDDCAPMSIVPYIPWRWRKRLVILGVILAFCVFIRRAMPSNVSPGSAFKADSTRFRPSPAPIGVPSRDGAKPSEQHYYNGQAKYYNLARSLRDVVRTGGSLPRNRNILFAASLNEISNLLPMACEMAKIDKNHVHLALFGRSNLSMEETMNLNGVSETCRARINLHDARPDLAEYSSDLREQTTIQEAMQLINKYMHPQAAIVDGGMDDNLLLSRAIRKACVNQGLPLIEVPAGMYEDFLWITRLTAEGLSKWKQSNIDIVVRAQPGNFGGLIRLLKSLSKADYRGLKVPRITVELPPKIDAALQAYLREFQWPPVFNSPASQTSLLHIHHRIPSSRLSSEESAPRFVELYYPRNPDNDNVLVLSPTMEVDPAFLQHLQYHILAYRYTAWFGGLAGISLDVPSLTLTGARTLRIPTLANSTANGAEDKRSDLNVASPFLYHAPSSTATLFFGDKWKALHEFIAKRLQIIHSGRDVKTKRIVSKSEPAWVEFLSELMRLRGWNVLHPSSALVTIHTGMAQLPEEYAHPADASRADHAESRKDQETYRSSDESYAFTERLSHDASGNHLPLHQMLSLDGTPAPLWTLPSLDFDGTEYQLGTSQEQYALDFRKAHGGCDDDNSTKFRSTSVMDIDDLFCLPKYQNAV